MSVFFTLSALCRKAKPSVVMWTTSSGICGHSTIAPDGCVKIITADYDSGWQLITLTAKTKEDADAEFNAIYYRICTPSQYDCTGQMFTVFYKLFKRNGRWMAYHHFAMDV